MKRSAIDTARSREILLAIWKLYRPRLRNSCFGPDRVSGRTFEMNLARELREIRHRLSGEFRANGLLAIPKLKPTGGHRIICVPTVADRLIQFALLVPLRERLRSMELDNPVSFGLAPGKDRSVLGARKLACQARQDRQWVYKADIQKFFDNLERPLLHRKIEAELRLRTLVPLLTEFSQAEIIDGVDPGWRKIVSHAGIKSGLGVRQGMPLSPWFAGLYLRKLDKLLAASGAPVVRYVDDIVAFFSSEAECREFHQLLRSALAELHLNIGDPGDPKSKTYIYPPESPAAFLGMEITRAPSGDRYCLFVPPAVLEDIRMRFVALSSPAGLAEQRVQLTTMGRYFMSLECGYVHAYEEAHNRDELRDCVKDWSTAAQRTVLESLFGLVRLQELSREELRFIGVDAV